MSDVDRKDHFDEKASSKEIDLANDPDAGLTEEERKAEVRDIAPYSTLIDIDTL